MGWVGIVWEQGWEWGCRLSPLIPSFLGYWPIITLGERMSALKYIPLTSSIMVDYGIALCRQVVKRGQYVSRGLRHVCYLNVAQMDT